jgi:poly(3-hydroxybutyrate) depolymerase
MRFPMGIRRAAPLLLLLALPGVVAADVITVGGRPVRCTWWEDGNEVVVNPYNSTNRSMTWGVERHSKSKVNTAKAKSSETPEEEYGRRAFEIRAGGAAEHAALAKWCAERKLEDLEAREWERVLEAEPANEEARKALGPPAVKEILRRNGKANPALGELLAQYLAADNAATRRVLLERMRKEHDLSLPAFAVERAFRSSKRPRGRTDDVNLSFRSKLVKGESGALYTMFVPPSYDPLRPTPLLVGLHGGGRGGKDGKEVVGSGPSAMNFYTGIGESRGWLVVCPTAIQAPWNDTVNGPFLEAVLAEVQLLYNVDLNRVYLTGHSMGGYGSWYWGHEWAERWAAVGPMAGGGCPGTTRFKETQTFVYLFHGTDDNVCAVQPDRTAAEQMLKGGNDFVYTELNGVGHGCPPEVLEEMAAHFEKKRLAIGKGKAFRRTDEIRSSFLEKPGPEERKYLGDPEPPDPNAKAEKPEEKRKRLLADIDLGGGKAEAAAEAYAEFKDEESVKALATRLLNPKIADDVRASAAKALGNVGSAECLPHLEKGLADGNDKVFHCVLGALTKIGDRKAGPALLRAVDLQSKAFDGKRQGANMDYTDFEARSSALAGAAIAAATLADPKEAVARIREKVIRTAFENAPHVEGLARAGMFPEEVRAHLGRSICTALKKTEHPGARDAVLALKAQAKGEAAILAACEDALAALPQ